MNRPLKFRIYSYLDKSFHYFTLEEGYPQGIAGGVSEPQQFTGCYDAHNKEIYEGDIVKEHHFDDWTDEEGYEYRGVVRYKIYDTSDVNRKFCGFITFPNERENKDYSGNPIHSDCEIIGNIFEHSELLK